VYGVSCITNLTGLHRLLRHDLAGCCCCCCCCGVCSDAAVYRM